MIRAVRARPEHAPLRVDPFVGDARVVGAAARRGAAQFVEHAARRRRTRNCASSRAARARPQMMSMSVRTPSGGAMTRRAAQHHAALRGSSSCRLPRPTARSAARRRRSPPFRRGRNPRRPADRARAGALDVRRVRRGDDGVGAHDEERADPVLLTDRVEQLVRRQAGPRQDPPATPHTSGDVRAGGRVVDAAVARQLIGFLAVLAAALAVALSGQAAVAAEGLADAGRARARC